MPGQSLIARVFPLDADQVSLEVSRPFPRIGELLQVRRLPRWIFRCKAQSGSCEAILFETDPVIAQTEHDQLGAADGVIGLPRSFHILPRGLDTDGEDHGNLPVGLSLGDKLEALAFARAEMRSGWPQASADEMARSAKSMKTDEFGAPKAVFWEAFATLHRKGAGPGWFSGNIDGNCKALAKAEGRAFVETRSLPTRKRSETLNGVPRKPVGRAAAGGVHGIVAVDALSFERGDPVCRIVVDPNEARWRAAQGRMMKKREIGKAELARCLAEAIVELIECRTACRIGGEAINEPPHRPLPM